ncbi:hypothetical protein BJ170DRAFT_684075 [Xylariales sp. AK1849]|nr:hypothetical protein BJ170DRAFT_684075 [Xylariales sp. AK1849]
MAAAVRSAESLQAPDVSQAEIDAFHREHFSSAAIEVFASDFLQPETQLVHGEDQYYEEYYEEYEEEDDSLGYYPDGVKRTLTDEQIAIFRHSELEALRRAEEKKPTKTSKASPAVVKSETVERPEIRETPELEDGEEEGELDSDTRRTEPSKSGSKKKKRKKSKKRKSNLTATQVQDAQELQRGDPGWFKKTIKPDLRKRTWDIVEAGMDSLDYDGLEATGDTGSGSAAQRRKISYDD